jgi:hypothetical protein
MKLKKFTIDDIRNFDPKPCYDPSRYLSEDWSGTALDILAVEEFPAKDRLWVVLHKKCIKPAIIDAFARWCALSVAHLWDMPDVVRQFLETGDETLRDAAGAAAAAAARTEVRYAAGDAAWSAARVAATAAAWDAAWSAARAAAWSVAWYAAWSAQVVQLREMLNSEAVQS